MNDRDVLKLVKLGLKRRGGLFVWRKENASHVAFSNGNFWIRIPVNREPMELRGLKEGSYGGSTLSNLCETSTDVPDTSNILPSGEHCTIRWARTRGMRVLVEMVVDNKPRYLWPFYYVVEGVRYDYKADSAYLDALRNVCYQAEEMVDGSDGKLFWEEGEGEEVEVVAVLMPIRLNKN